LRFSFPGQRSNSINQSAPQERRQIATAGNPSQEIAMTIFHICNGKWLKVFRSHALRYAQIVLLCVICLGHAEQAAAATYSLAITPQFEYRKLFEIWNPIVAELEKRTGLSFKLITNLSLEEYEQEVGRGNPDFIYANPYLIVKENRNQGYLPLVRDRAPIRGILVVRKESPVRQVSQLNGKSIAIPSPNALGGGLLLRADLDQIFHIKFDQIYAKSHTSAYLHVLNGLADAGGGVEKTLQEQEQAVQEALRVLYTTRKAPSLPVAAHPRVPAKIREKVRRALLDMANTPDGMALLAKVPMKQPVPASLEEYLAMRSWHLNNYWVKEF